VSFPSGGSTSSCVCARAIEPRAFPTLDRSSSEPFVNIVAARTILFSTTDSIASRNAATERVQEQDHGERRCIRHDHDAARERVGVGALQRRVHGVRNRRDRDGSRDGGIQVLRDLSCAADDDPLDGPRARFALRRFASGLERLELGERRPLRVDREPTSVGKDEPELDDLAVEANVGLQQAGRQLRQPLAQDVLARAAGGRSAGEHRGEAADDLTLLRLGQAALLVAHAKLVERPPGSLEALSQLLRGKVAPGGVIRHPTKLGGLHAEIGVDRSGPRPIAARRHHRRSRDRPDRERSHHDPPVRRRHDHLLLIEACGAAPSCRITVPAGSDTKAGRRVPPATATADVRASRQHGVRRRTRLDPHDPPMNDVALARDGELGIRLLRNDAEDLTLITRWRAEPHVHEWWDPDDPPPTFEEVAADYGSRTHPSSPTTACLIELDGRPIGYLQFYRWASYADEAWEMGVDADDATFGLDLFIGEPDLLGLGYGSRVVAMVSRYLETDRGATRISLTTEITNVRAQRAYEKAGFRRVREVLDIDTRNGQRARCWLMTREAVPVP
jgi:aminoglycoside 6'-N-acetyltransferase